MIRRATTRAQTSVITLTDSTTMGMTDEPVDSMSGPMPVGTIKAPMAAAPTIHDVALAVNEILSSTMAIMVGYCGPALNL